MATTKTLDPGTLKAMRAIIGAALLRRAGDGEAAAMLHALSDLDPGDLWSAAVALAESYVPEEKARRFALAMAAHDTA